LIHIGCERLSAVVLLYGRSLGLEQFVRPA